MTRRLRVIAVDDEPLARQRIRKLLGADKRFELVAECSDGRQAIAAIERFQPDLVLLDIQLPELDGFEVIDALAAPRAPLVIFLSAYDEFALRAFEVNAIDYVLKPLDPKRFRAALSRAYSLLAAATEGEIARRLLEAVHDARGAAPQRIIVKVGSRDVFLSVDEIDWIEASENYIRIHVGAEAMLVRQTLAGFHEKLDARRFIRIHRAVVVNVDRIAEIERPEHDECWVKLRNRQRLPLGDSYRGNLKTLLDRFAV
jgi:two-component system LytT family response regulator